MRKNGNTYTVFMVALQLIVWAGCTDSNQPKRVHDTPTSGTIQISVDESFRPVIEQQINMYQASYPSAHIEATYKSEADCFKDFFKDSSKRLIIVGRGLTSAEERYMIDELSYNPGWNAVASDAVAIIIPQNSPDSLFTLASLKALFSGQSRSGRSVVFDGLQATSTIRYIKDSVMKGIPFDTTVVRAASNSQEVVEYVATHENAIGLVGISWVGNPEEPQQVAKLKKIKMAYVQCEACVDKPFVQPNQQSMLTRRYPLVRPVCYIIKENYEGLGRGFVSFLKFERGQLIFRRAYLGPVMDFEVRNVKINAGATKK